MQTMAIGNQTQWTADFRAVEQEMWEIAKAFVSVRPRIILKWNERFTRRMGDASVSRGVNTIRLSVPLWPLATPEKRRNTSIHELAHIYANIEKGRGHGPIWRRWMLRFGETPTRCYQVNEENFHNPEAVADLRQSGARYLLTCPTCTSVLKITSNLRTRWVNKRQIRLCTTCRGQIPHTVAQAAIRGKRER